MGRALLALVVLVLFAPPASAQHEQHAPAPSPSGWHFMQDGVVFVTFNHQGGPLGETELASQNWWMGMLSRQAGPGRLTLSTMLSLEPITERGRYTGYSRFEATEVETDVLRFGVHPPIHSHDGFSPPHVVLHDRVAALTLGATRDLWRWVGFDFAPAAM